MNWFYVDAGQQAGPVTDEQLDELVRNGKVRADTLVWRDGLANWQAYSQARPEGVQPPGPPPLARVAPLPPGTAPTGNEVVCAECHQVFQRADTIQYGNAWVCANCKPGFVQRLQQGGPMAMPGAAAGMHYAGFWIRFLAKVIDGLIVGVVFGIPIAMLALRGVMSGGVNQSQPWMTYFSFGPWQFLSWAISILYNGFFIGKFGATPGKMALGLKVVSPEGSDIGFGRSFGRAAAEIISQLICYIGYIIAAFDSQKRALHDHIASTRVIRTRF